MLHALQLVAMLFCAVQAIRAERLLHSAIWLAGVSALLAVEFYQLGAAQVAVIELSVGAGLVTVLFVFAIGIAGDVRISLKPVVPRPLAWGLVIAAILLLGILIMPNGHELVFSPPDPAIVVGNGVGPLSNEESIQTVIWDRRGLDALVQVVLMFSGVLGLLGLLAEAQGPLQNPRAAEVAAIRDRELLALEESVRQQEKELA